MKNVFFVLAMFICMQINAQEPEALQYDTIFSIEGSKEILFRKARLYIVEAFKDENEVLTVIDSASGEIHGNGCFIFNASKFYYGCEAVKGCIMFKFSVFVKDDKARIRLYNLKHEGQLTSYGFVTNLVDAPIPSKGMAVQKAWDDIYNKSVKESRAFIGEFEKALTKNDLW